MNARTTQTGIGVVFVLAVVIVAYWLFGGANEEWFVRAARDGAVQCLTRAPCAFVDAEGKIAGAKPPPLSSASPCADPKAWQRVDAGSQVILLTCTDGKTYLYHFGKTARPEGGDAQWTICREPSCDDEMKSFSKLASRGQK
jgi:hypothetical protein